MSDHLPYFISINTIKTHSKPSKYIYSGKYDEVSSDLLYQKIKSFEIYEKLNKDIIINPNINDDILDKLFACALNQIMPFKKIKNNKYKQKRSNWVTNGIIKSIQYRDKLYKSLKQTLYDTPSYFTLKQWNFKTMYSRSKIKFLP